MRLLGETDYNDYEGCTGEIRRNSARMIIIENNKIYLSHTRRNDTYKLPGGGVDFNEDILSAALRETKEEVGVICKLDKISEYGYYLDKWKSVHPKDDNKVWINTSYFYIGEKSEIVDISPTESEKFDQVESVCVDIDIAIEANEKYIKAMGENLKERFLIRENNIFKLIKKELLK